MKKIILIIGAVLGSSFVVNAQEQTQTQTQTTQTTSTPAPTTSSQDNSSSVYFGARYLATFTDVNLAQTNGGALATSFVMGYGWEGLVGINFGNHVALQGELLYSSLQQNFTDQFDIQRKITLDYLQVPILLVLNTNSNGPVNFNVAFGPQWGVLLSSKVSNNGAAEGDTVSAVVNSKPTDFGIAYGAGFDFRLVQYLYLNIGYRGVYGLIDIDNDTKTIGNNQYYLLRQSHVTTYAGYAGLTLKF